MAFENWMKRTERNHLDLLCDVGELISGLAGSSDVESFLKKIVVIVGRHLQSDVCSVYLYDEGEDELVLR
ncbi:MAG: hypothetical protein ACLFVU_14770, partial [Phycisphaerae bacterium]